MKLAGTSRSFASAFDRGDLTQLEFLDLAAHELRVDGVVLDERHFPRNDDDYLAQLKKMAVDYGLTIAALESDSLLGGDADTIASTLRVAALLGAPLVSTRVAGETQRSWSAQAERLSEATGAAKQANVTLAVRNAPGTFAASSSDCKRVAKEADSAWLRFALDPHAFDAASNPADLAERTVMLYAADADPDAFITMWCVFSGFVVIESHEQSAHRRWRHALASFELNRT